MQIKFDTVLLQSVSILMRAEFEIIIEIVKSHHVTCDFLNQRNKINSLQIKNILSRDNATKQFFLEVFTDTRRL